MNHEKYDVIVVGAGPGGSIAARETSRAGLSTLLIEKRQEIGTHIRCAEGASLSTISHFIEPDPKWISQVIEGVRLTTPDGGFLDIASPGGGVVLERKIFDRSLAELAAEAGARVRVKSLVTGILLSDGAVSGVRIRSCNIEENIAAKIVIAADGVESQVGRWAGLKTGFTISDIYVCAQYLLAGIQLKRPNYCHFYFGMDTGPGGYAWAFPKSDNTANVGLGIRPRFRQNTGQTAKYVLDKFVRMMFPEASPVSFVMGAVPIDGEQREISGNGIMVVGDAAHQTDPLTGGGIGNAMVAGKLAAKTAIDAFDKGDFSSAFLSTYDRRWYKSRGKRFKHLVRIRNEFMLFKDEDFNRLADKAGRGGLTSLVDIYRIAFASKPSLLFDIGKLIFYGWFKH